MIDRDIWEDAIKGERQAMLDQTRDPHTRRKVAAIIDAFSDRLYDRLETTLKVKNMAERSKKIGGKEDGC